MVPYLDGAIGRSRDQLPSDELARPDTSSMSGECRQQAEVVCVPDFAGLVLRGRRHEVAADVDRVDILKVLSKLCHSNLTALRFEHCEK